MKKLLVLILAFMASFSFLYFLVSMDQPARHPALRAASLPPMIPIHDLFSAHDETEGTVQDKPPGQRPKTGSQEPPGAQAVVTTALTLPHTGPDPGPLPTVVMIGGGPQSGISRDNEKMIRLLANRGYAVLSIRCSAVADTAGRARAESGFETANGCTAATIGDETRRVIALQITDAKAVAVLGSGMAGNLALMAMASDPSLFKAAIAHSAFVGRMISMPVNGNNASSQTSAAITGTDAAAPDRNDAGLVRQSLSAFVQRIHGAVLITHGNTDKIAPAEHVHLLAQALHDAGKPCETAFFNHEAHSYTHWETRAQVARLQEIFLAHHLGGRNGGYDYIELLAKLL